MNYLASMTLALSLLLTGGQNPGFFGQNALPAPTAAACTPPPIADRWAVANPANVCGTGTCSNGLGISTLADYAHSITMPATQTTVADQPEYTANAFNGHPGATFDGQQSWGIAGYMPTIATLVVYGIEIDTSGSRAIFGGSATGGELEWRVTGGQQQLLIENRAIIGSGATTYVNGSVHTFAATYNQNTYAWALYDCVAGTCNVDAQGTTSNGAVGVINNATNTIGAAPAAQDYMDNFGLEWNFASGTASVAGVAAYSLCQYGI